MNMRQSKVAEYLIIFMCSFTIVYSSSCQPLNRQLSQCSNYINDGDVYYNSDQSSHLAAALNATVTIVGSYCRDRAMELLCNYFFPQCVNDDIVPICSSSCSEYLYTGICFSHILTLLSEINNTGNYPNVSVDKLLQRDCSPPYNLSVSENCVTLTAVPPASDSVQCVPLPEDEPCKNYFLNLSTYAIDVAQIELNRDIVVALEGAISVLQQPEHADTDAVCITILRWIICVFAYPPCSNYKLLLPCSDTCGNILSFFLTCHDVIETQVDDVPVRLHFRSFGCLIAETYYEGVDKIYFNNNGSECFEPRNVLSTNEEENNNNINNNNDDDSNNVGIIIGVVLGCCTVILVVIVLLLIVYVRRKRKVYEKEKFPRFVKVISDMMDNPDTTQKSLQKRQGFSLSSYPIFADFQKSFAGEIIDPNHLIKLELIGKGAFGKVHKGLYTKGMESIDIAIKTLRAVDGSKIEEFIKECIITKKFHHSNVLGLIGVSYNREEGIGAPVMVLPYMHNGDIKTFLKAKRGKILDATEFPEELDHNILTNMCLDIANGMEYLSSSRYVHRDLAARNCMLDKNMVAKVADFGLSRDVYLADYYRLDHKAPLPVKWLSPEALVDKVFTSQSDVWSFGVTCWEIFTLGLQPYPTVDEYDMVNYLKSGKTLDKPPLSSDEMYEVMKSCWKFTPEDRADFPLLVKQLALLQK